MMRLNQARSAKKEVLKREEKAMTELFEDMKTYFAIQPDRLPTGALIADEEAKKAKAKADAEREAEEKEKAKN